MEKIIKLSYKEYLEREKSIEKLENTIHDLKALIYKQENLLKTGPHVFLNASVFSIEEKTGKIRKQGYDSDIGDPFGHRYFHSTAQKIRFPYLQGDPKKVKAFLNTELRDLVDKYNKLEEFFTPPPKPQTSILWGLIKF